METGSFFPELPAMPSVDNAEEIIPYEPPRRYSFTKLVDAGVHISTVEGEPAWSDGYMMQVSEVPEGLKKLKRYWVRSGPDDKPRDFDALIPDMPPDAPVVTPLAVIKGRAGIPGETVYLAEMRKFLEPYGRPYEGAEIAIDRKYVDYFLFRYPRAEFVMRHKASPAVVRDKGKLVGVIMPIFADPAVLQSAQDHVWTRVFPAPTPPVSPVEPTPPKPRPPAMTVGEAEMTYSLRQLQQMARTAGLSPVGSKRVLIRNLIQAGALR